MVNRYIDKHNSIRNKLYVEGKEYNIEELKIIYYNLISLWHEEFFLKSKEYISEELWLVINTWIKQDIRRILNKNLSNYKDK